LFDIHGTSVIEDDPADLYLGTANGASLVADFDRRNIFMQHGLHGLLKWSRRLKDSGGQSQVFRYIVSPADETVTETSEVSGGFTVRHMNQNQQHSIEIIRHGMMLKPRFSH
jgi:hypothetical protein